MKSQVFGGVNVFLRMGAGPSFPVPRAPDAVILNSAPNLSKARPALSSDNAPDHTNSRPRLNKTRPGVTQPFQLREAAGIPAAIEGHSG